MASAFLRQGASDDELVRAAAANQRAWMIRSARASGGSVHREVGLTWAIGPSSATLAFPQLTASGAGARLDAFVQAACFADVHEASCWSLLPTRPPDLGERLLGYGFEPGWQAQWMALDLRPLPALRRVLRVAIEPVAETPDWGETGLPYDEAGSGGVYAALEEGQPRRLWYLAAWGRGRPVGHGKLFLTTGRQGVGGIYDVGVAVAERRRGIGWAITRELCAIAAGQGCHVATLNATHEGRLLYEAMGFRFVGVAQTWWLHRRAIRELQGRR